MNPIARTWLGFAALGAGLIHVALTVGAGFPLAVVLVLVAACEIGWGVLALTSERLPFPRSARAVALAPVALWALALALQLDFAASLAAYPMVAASALDLAVAIGVTAVLRYSERARPSADAAPPVQDPSPSRQSGAHLVVMFAGALVIAAVTVPALVAAGAGRFGGPPPSEPASTETPEVGHVH